jgi:GAF domain-containing protein
LGKNHGIVNKDRHFTQLNETALTLLHEKGWDGIALVCELLRAEVPHYHWVGIYWMNNAEQALHLGPFAGAATEHTRIPYGRGICGQVALSGEVFEVPDVWAQDNYLACSMETKAELVVPIHSKGRLIGQIDIDSHDQNPFGPEDTTLLHSIAEAIGSMPEAQFIG